MGLKLLDPLAPCAAEPPDEVPPYRWFFFVLLVLGCKATSELMSRAGE